MAIYCMECGYEIQQNEAYVESIRRRYVCSTCYEKYSTKDICRKVFGLPYYMMDTKNADPGMSYEERCRCRCTVCDRPIDSLDYTENDGEYFCEDCLDKIKNVPSDMFDYFGCQFTEA